MSINTVIEDLGMNEFPHDRSENEKRVKYSTKGRRHKYGRCRTKCGRGWCWLETITDLQCFSFPHTQERWKEGSDHLHLFHTWPLINHLTSQPWFASCRVMIFTRFLWGNNRASQLKGWAANCGVGWDPAFMGGSAISVQCIVLGSSFPKCPSVKSSRCELLISLPHTSLLE